MDKTTDYITCNKKAWNKKVAIHLNADFYNLEGFLQGENSLKDIELALLKDIKGKRILHLQCHFGQDSISLSRLGAKVTGVDLSDKAIAAAKQLAKKTNTNTQFICCDLYELPKHLDQKFDLVFTSYGTIAWLPDMDKWAGVISHFLKPNGRFVFVEFHPVVWMFDDSFEKIQYSYFNTGPIAGTEKGTYADKKADINSSYIVWNHAMAEVIQSLIKNKLSLESLQELDYSPYDCFEKTIAIAPGKYRIAHLDAKIPMVYALSCKKQEG